MGGATGGLGSRSGLKLITLPFTNSRVEQAYEP